MYCDFYGFTEKPFHITPNPRFLYLSKNHKEAFAHLLYGINNHSGFIALTGEVGTGKTTVLRTLLEELDENTHRTALIFNPCLSSLELLRSINREFGLNCEGLQSAELLEQLYLFLLAQNREGRTVVLVIDEAQNLDPQVMEQIRLISNLESETDKLIQIVLAGQPELNQLLKRTDLRQLSQRITVSYHLLPMDFADTRGYIEHRLKIAGKGDTHLFTSSALRKIFSYANGSPRLINIACDRTLLLGYAENRLAVSGRMAATAIKELRGGRQQYIRIRYPDVSTAAFAMCLIAAVCLFIVYRTHFKASGTTFKNSIDTKTSTAIAVPVTSAVQTNPVKQIKTETASILPTKTAPSAGKLPLQPKYKEDTLPKGKDLTWTALPKGPLPAFNAILNQWKLPSAASSASDDKLEKLALQNGLGIIPVTGDLNSLRQLDMPVLLTVKPTGSDQARYVAVTGVQDGKYSLNPAPDGKAFVSGEELRKVWTGKGRLFWKNHQNIPTSLKLNDSGVEVIRLQILLAGAGSYKGEPSGVFDEATVAALKSFQASRKIKPDGRVSGKTLIILYRDGGKLYTPKLREGTSNR